MQASETPHEVLRLWKTPGDLAQDIGLPRDTVRKWWDSLRIPETAWGKVVEAAAGNGHTVTVMEIMAANVPLRKRGWPKGKPRKAVRAKGKREVRAA